MAAFASFGATITYNIGLNGANEAPPTGSLGIGSGTVIIDTTLHTMAIDMSFSGLTGTVTAAHIHCCTAVPFTGTAGVATVTPTFTGFPSGVTSGSYNRTFDMTLAASYNPAFITARGGTVAQAEADLFAGMAAGTTYFNIHTTTAPGGEIRGFLIPEPGTFMLTGAGALVGLAFARRRKVQS